MDLLSNWAALCLVDFGSDRKPIDYPSGKPEERRIVKTNAITEAAMPSSSNDTPVDREETHRKVILHYHLFKNAGTSLDHTLKKNFANGWHEHEGPGGGWRTEDATDYLRQHPEIVVLSSHTALLPPPVLQNTTVYPIIFLRHPIDRIRSIYEFERKQSADTVGARVAKEIDLAGYVKWRLDRRGDRSIRNFQAYRLAFAAPELEDGKTVTEEIRALRALVTLPFVGVVEKFDESLAKLQQWLKPAFPSIDLEPTKANVTQRAEMSLDERLKALAEEIGEELYMEVSEANCLDMKLHEIVSALPALR